MLNEMMLSVFWPFLTSVLFLFLYTLLLWDFYDNLFGLNLPDSIYLISGVTCFLVLPFVGLLQLGYGIFKTAKKKDDHGRDHIRSSVGVIVSYVLFLIMENVVVITV